jgi:hypothetical protein
VGNQVGRRDVCSSCGAELHACRHCRHFDLAVAKECKEPFAEVPRDKDGANFCEFFQIGEGGRTDQERKDQVVSAFAALFKKPGQ